MEESPTVFELTRAMQLFRGGKRKDGKKASASPQDPEMLHIAIL
jgi:hypothetical protein